MTTTNEDAGPSDEQIETAIDAWFTYDEAHAHDFKWRMRNALLEAQALAPSKVQAEAVREEAPSWTNPRTPYGMLVRALRIVANTTLMDMSKYSQVGPAALSAVEFGRQPVTDEILVVTAEFFTSLGVPDTLQALWTARNAEIKRIDAAAASGGEKV
jgi:hypothetical protein